MAKAVEFDWHEIVLRDIESNRPDENADVGIEENWGEETGAYRRAKP